MTRFEVVTGDITRLDVDVIVNAANERLIPGGGVDGAIHRAAGPELARATRALGGCPKGSARITPGFDLPARWVVHAVGPVWTGGDAGESLALTSCYRNAIALAEAERATSIAFPAISTGVYGYPLEAATAIAVATVRGTVKGTSIERVVFCCFDARTRAAYDAALSA